MQKKKQVHLIDRTLPQRSGGGRQRWNKRTNLNVCTIPQTLPRSLLPFRLLGKAVLPYQIIPLPPIMGNTRGVQNYDSEGAGVGR